MTNKCIYICFTVKITVNKNNLKKKKISLLHKKQV